VVLLVVVVGYGVLCGVASTCVRCPYRMREEGGSNNGQRRQRTQHAQDVTVVNRTVCTEMARTHAWVRSEEFEPIQSVFATCCT